MTAIRTAEFRRYLRRIYLEKLSGYLYAHYQDGFKIYRGKLSFVAGELSKVTYLSLRGREAMARLCGLELSNITFTTHHTSERPESDTPPLSDYVGGRYEDPEQQHIVPIPPETLEARSRKLMTRLYGKQGEARIALFSEHMSIQDNPSLFIDYCEELAELMLNRSFAQRLISSLYH